MSPAGPATTLQRAARGSLLNVAGAGVTAVANLVLAIAVAQLVDQGEAGVFFSATSLFLMVASIAQLGTNTGLVYFISGARSTGQISTANAYMRTAAGPVLITSLVLGVLMFVFAGQLGELLTRGPDEVAVEQFASFARVTAFFLPAAAVFNLALSGTRGLGTMNANAGLDQVARPLLQLAVPALVIAAAGADLAALGWTATYVPLAVAAWIWWTKLRDRSTGVQVEPDTPVAGPFWRFTAPRALAGVAQVAMQRLDIVLVGALAGLEEAAIYTAATRFLVLGQSVARAVSTSVQPLLGESLATGDRDDAKKLYQASTAWLVMITWPLYLTLILFGDVVLAVFGDDYVAEGGRALTILCVAMLVATACGMVDMVLTMAGRSLWNLTNVLVAFTVYVAVDIVLIPQYGLIGAAIGWSCGILAANILPLSQVRMSLGVHPYGRGTIVAMLLGAATFGGVPVVVITVMSSSVPALVLSLSLSLALYAAGVHRFRASLRLHVLRSGLRRRGRK